MHQHRIELAFLAGMSFAACVDSSPGPSLDHVQQEVLVDNGISLNGISLNGISLNGISLNGISLNGISLNGISLNGISLNGISLNGISLNGISLDGTTLQGVVGSTWNGVLSNGATIPLRIDAATTGTGSNSDVGMFQMSYRNELGWQPLCGRELDGAPTLALAVAGTWDPYTAAYARSDSLVTFACRGKSIAKCVELGYKPWNGHADHLASCVRLLRADYCGDGTSYTQDGTLLNLYDNIGVQLDTESWDKEAEWTVDGARCISYPRQARFLLTLKVPHCLQDGTLKVTSTCGATFASGTKLVSELPPR